LYLPEAKEIDMPRCILHPGREATVTIADRSYCAECDRGMTEARSRVDRHVEPKDCFIWYVGSDKWQPIFGTGCAHWVAHQRGIRRGTPGEQCLLGFPYRVRALIQGSKIVTLENVLVNDIYVTPAFDHTGLVIRVTPGSKPSDPRKIMIKHDSSGQGRVAENDFATYFHGRGAFYRQS
jgi:hypothetical protein